MRATRSARDRAALAEPEFPPPPLRYGDAADPYPAIRGGEIHATLAEIVELTRAARPAGEPYWGRIAGTRGEIAAAEYMAAEFKAAGLEDVALQRVQGGAQWWPLEWRVTLLGNPVYGAGTSDYTFPSAFPALSLEGEPFAFEGEALELVYVGRGHPIDVAGRDVEGKVAVVHAHLQPDGFFQSARGYVDDVIEAGAVAVLTVMDAPGNHQYALEDMGPHDAPAFVLGGDDGRFLLDALVAAGTAHKLRVDLRYRTTIRRQWESFNAVGTVRGRSDEWVVLLAHLDGYFDSANDNGGGLASMIALARHYGGRATPPERNLLFAATAGHHEFSDGAEALIEAHRDKLEQVAVVMNIEHPASVMTYFRGPLRFKRFTLPGQLIGVNTMGTRALNVSNGNPLLVQFYRDAIARYGLVINASRENQPPTGDAFGFYRAGYPVVQIIDTNLWYHSTGDGLDTIEPGGLERATKVYAEVLDRIDATPREALRERGR